MPRFVEELTRAFLRSAKLRGGEICGPRSPTIIPASLQSWLSARRDRLGSVREVARVASVLGREFTREQLKALVPSAGDIVERALDQLVEAELLRRCGSRWRCSYRFRLALDREAAYGSLIDEHRRLYERRAAAQAGLAEDSSPRSPRAATRPGSPAPSLKSP